MDSWQSAFLEKASKAAARDGVRDSLSKDHASTRLLNRRLPPPPPPPPPQSSPPPSRTDASPRSRLEKLTPWYSQFPASGAPGSGEGERPSGRGSAAEWTAATAASAIVVKTSSRKLSSSPPLSALRGLSSSSSPGSSVSEITREAVRAVLREG